MNFADQAHETSAFFTAHPEPFHLFWLVVVFIMNFAICRFLSIQLVEAGYVKKYILFPNRPRIRKINPEYKKLFLFWFFPVVGVAGLIALYIICVVGKTKIAIKSKLFLNHI